MGGALALHFGYRFCTDLAGVFAMSSFLNEKSSVYDVSGLNSFFLFYGFTLPHTVNCCSRLFFCIFMASPVQTGRWRYYVLNVSVHSSILHPSISLLPNL